MFFICIAQLALYEFATVMEFIQDREVFIKESASNNYPVHAYYLSKILLEFPLMMILPLIENLLTFFVIGYRQNWYTFC